MDEQPKSGNNYDPKVEQEYSKWKLIKIEWWLKKYWVMVEQEDKWIVINNDILCRRRRCRNLILNASMWVCYINNSSK